MLYCSGAYDYVCMGKQYSMLKGLLNGTFSFPLFDFCIIFAILRGTSKNILIKAQNLDCSNQLLQYSDFIVCLYNRNNVNRNGILTTKCSRKGS
jgi:hypothetical protein